MTTRTKAKAKKRTDRRGMGRDPFLLIVRAAGVDIDVRVEDRRSMSAVSEGISEGLRPYIPVLIGAIQGAAPGAARDPIAWPYRPAVVDLVELVVSVIQDDSQAPEDGEIDKLIEVLSRERERRVELRS